MLVTTLTLAILASSAPTTPFVPTSTPTPMTLAGGEQVEVHITVDQTPQLLLVRQISVDVVVQCSDGVVRNAPLGRVGLEAVVLDQSSHCKIAPKMKAAVKGEIQVSRHVLDAPMLGADLGHWRSYANAITQNNEHAASLISALAHYAALQRLESIEDELRRSIALSRANLYRRSREYKQALIHYTEAADLSKQSPGMLAQIYNGTGLSFYGLHDWTSAQRAFESALNIAESNSLHYEAAAGKNNLCLLMQKQDQLNDAATCFQDAAQMFSDAGEQEHRTVALSNWADVAQGAGDAAGALRALDAVYEQRRHGPQQRALALTAIRLASLNTQLGNFDVALGYAQEAITRLSGLGANADLARAYRTYAAVLRDLGQTDRAISYLVLAREAAEGQPQIVATVLAEHAALLGRTSEASAMRRQAQTLYELTQSTAASVREGIEESRDMIAAGKLDLAARQLTALAARIPVDDLARRARHALAVAEMALAAGNDVPASRVHEPITLYRKLTDAEGVMDATLLAARWELTYRRPKEALELLLAVARDHARALRSSPSPALAASYVAQHRGWKDLLLEALAMSGPSEMTPDLLWSSVAEFNELPGFRERGSTEDWRRFRLISAQLRASQDATTSRQQVWLREIDLLDQRLRVAERPQRRTEISQWRAALPVGDLLIRFLVGEQHSLAMWVRRDGVRIDALPGRASLRDQIARARVDQNAALTLSRLLLPSAKLSDLKGRLLIIPDDELHTLPFASLALQQPELTRPVVIVAGTTIPDFALLDQLPSGFGVLSVNMPALQPLPGPLRIRQQLSRVLGSRMIRADLVSGTPMPLAHVVQIAGHGWFHAAFPGAAALSGDAPGELQAQTFAVADIIFDEPPRVMVLNACDVGGADHFGAGLSLAREFAQSYSTVVVGPTEPVDDGVALEFDLAFFKALEQQPPDHALRTALLALPVDRRNVLPPWQLLVSGRNRLENSGTRDMR